MIVRRCHHDRQATPVFFCPYLPYKRLNPRQQRVGMARMRSVISLGGFVSLTTGGMGDGLSNKLRRGDQLDID